MNYYHVTYTHNVRKILRHGLRLMQTSNWVDGEGRRQGTGEIYAFESRWDAIRWAGIMDWEYNRDLGTGKISIVAFDGDGNQWDNDLHDPLRQAASEARWLKTWTPVAAARIEGSEVLTPALVRAGIAYDRDRWAQPEVVNG